MSPGLDQRKLLRVDDGYILEPFHKRLERGNRWAEIWTRPGKKLGDEWVEIMAGLKDEEGVHYHLGINKNASRRFLKKRGVLKSITEFAMNKRTGELLDKNETVFGEEGKYSLVLLMDASRVTRKVWVSEFKLVPAEQLGDIAPRK